MNGIIGDINWKSTNVILDKRIFLFCFNDRCMSGKIKGIRKLRLSKGFEIEVNFIEPDFFKEDAIIGNHFTIQEASKILGEGKVKAIV